MSATLADVLQRLHWLEQELKERDMEIVRLTRQIVESTGEATESFILVQLQFVYSLL